MVKLSYLFESSPLMCDSLYCFDYFDNLIHK